MLFDEALRGIDKECRLPIAVHPHCPYALIRAANIVERQRFAIRTPRLWLVLRSRLGLRQPLSGAAAVSELPEHRGVAFSIGLEGDVSAVRAPDGNPIAAGERQTPQRRCRRLE